MTQLQGLSALPLILAFLLLVLFVNFALFVCFSEMCTAYRISWYVLLSLCATSLTQGELTRICDVDIIDKRGFCGTDLSRALSLVCGNQGYHYGKRSAGMW